MMWCIEAISPRAIQQPWPPATRTAMLIDKKIAVAITRAIHDSRHMTPPRQISHPDQPGSSNSTRSTHASLAAVCAVSPVFSSFPPHVTDARASLLVSFSVVCPSAITSRTRPDHPGHLGCGSDSRHDVHPRVFGAPPFEPLLAACVYELARWIVSGWLDCGRHVHYHP